MIESDFPVCWNCQFSKDGSPPHFAPPQHERKEIEPPIITFPLGVRLYRASFSLVTLGIALMPFFVGFEGAPFNRRSFIPVISFYLSVTILCLALISIVIGRIQLGHNPESYGVQLTDLFRQAFFGMFLFVPFLLLAMMSPLLFVGGILFWFLHTWYWAGNTKEVEQVRKATAEKLPKAILSGEGAEHFGSTIVDQEVHGIIADAYLYFGPDEAKRMISTLSINDLKNLIESKKRTNG
jgi:hypothetical protein